MGKGGGSAWKGYRQWHAVRQLTKWQKGAKRQRETWGNTKMESRGRERGSSREDRAVIFQQMLKEKPRRPRGLQTGSPPRSTDE